MPVGRVDRGGADAHEDFVAAQLRLGDLGQFKHLWLAVSVLDDRLHRATVTITFPLLCPASTYRCASAICSSG
jgi:hypothetical protein